MREGSLRACAAGHNIPVMIYEAGEALRFDELCIRAGIRGILQVMRKLDMLPPGRGRKSAHAVIARSTSWVRAPASGIVTGSVALGSRVKHNDRLALISDPLGDREEAVCAPFDGIVIGCSRLPLAHEGDALFHLAAFSSVGRAENAVEEFATIHDPALRRTVESDLLET
jgi:predicted deacylase